MTEVLLLIFDLIGTIAFAISGALVGVGKRMDLFGTIVLAVCTATGGGVLRDLMVGNIPPYMFRNPLFVGIAALVALVVFFLLYLHTKMPKILSMVYDKMLFWFDTLGLAAFTVDGVMVGIRRGYEDNAFLLVFLGFLTAVGGGTLRDVLAGRIPDIFLKHIYAVAAIAGGMTMTLTRFLGARISMILGFGVVIALRCLAAHYRWNLPRIKE